MNLEKQLLEAVTQLLRLMAAHKRAARPETAGQDLNYFLIGTATYSDLVEAFAAAHGIADEVHASGLPCLMPAADVLRLAREKREQTLKPREEGDTDHA